MSRKTSEDLNLQSDTNHTVPESTGLVRTWKPPMKEIGPVINFMTNDSDGVMRDHSITFVARWSKINTSKVLVINQLDLLLLWYADHTMCCELHGMDGKVYRSFDELTNLESFDEGFESVLARAFLKALDKVRSLPKTNLPWPLMNGADISVPGN